MSWRRLEAGPLGWAKEGTGRAAAGAALGEGPGVRGLENADTAQRNSAWEPLEVGAKSAYPFLSFIFLAALQSVVFK